MTGVIPKPVMRHVFMSKTKRNLIELVLVSAASVIAFKLLYMDPRVKRHEEFYQTYDCEAALKRMNEAGLMQSFSKK